MVPSALADAQIVAQERLRALAASAVTAAWRDLPAYDEQQVPAFIARAAPVVQAAQRQSVTLTDAYLARALGRAPLGLDPIPLIGAAVRAGVPDEERWRRPFVTVWTALQQGTAWDAATDAGLARARSIATTDVQLTHRAALAEAQRRDERIRGYVRRADGGACSYCLMIDGAFVKSADVMPLHPGCGCGLEPETEPAEPTATPDGVVIHEHGELGPVIGSPDHDFTHL